MANQFRCPSQWRGLSCRLAGRTLGRKPSVENVTLMHHVYERHRPSTRSSSVRLERPAAARSEIITLIVMKRKHHDMTPSRGNFGSSIIGSVVAHGLSVFWACRAFSCLGHCGTRGCAVCGAGGVPAAICMLVLFFSQSSDRSLFLRSSITSRSLAQKVI